MVRVPLSFLRSRWFCHRLHGPWGRAIIYLARAFLHRGYNRGGVGVRFAPTCVYVTLDRAHVRLSVGGERVYKAGAGPGGL